MKRYKVDPSPDQSRSGEKYNDRSPISSCHSSQVGGAGLYPLTVAAEALQANNARICSGNSTFTPCPVCRYSVVQCPVMLHMRARVNQSKRPEGTSIMYGNVRSRMRMLVFLVT